MARGPRSQGKKGGKSGRDRAPTAPGPADTRPERVSRLRRIGGRLASLRTLFQDIQREPALLVPLVIGAICVGWVLYNAFRPWTRVEGVVASRDVFMTSDTDDEGVTTYFYYADFEYVYDAGSKQFRSSFQDNTVGENGGSPTSDFGEAVVEAKRFQVGDRLPLYVDSRHPEVSTRTLPSRFWPLFWIALATVGLYIWLGAGFLAMLLCGLVQIYLTWSLTRLPTAEVLDAPYRLSPFLEMVKGYPSLGYVPQNQLHRKFGSLEELLKSWGRPDAVWVEDVDQSRSLTLTYRHGSDWSQAWSVDFQVTGDGPPVPMAAPRQDDPERPNW